MVIEKMSDFFTARVDGYDEHMLSEVEGCKEAYGKVAELLSDTVCLLDLGCGTGLELDEVFKRNPSVHVTGIDLTPAMLTKLRQKHPDKNMTLINASYLDCEFGTGTYDAVISFQTLHHFSPEVKLGLYEKVFKALKTGGHYIECDYMVTTKEDEDFYFGENKRIRAEQGIPDGEFYHYDTPCTIDHQIKLLSEAGFPSVKMIWRVGNTTIVIARNL